MAKIPARLNPPSRLTRRRCGKLRRITPLTSIRGYAELIRSGVISTPDDQKAALVRVEAEATRMGTLVEDLLLLARMDQGRPLELGSVDLGRVAQELVADARAADPARSWTVEIDPEVVVRGDEARLRQVVANFVTNARIHTPGGRPVEVAVRRFPNDVELYVRDHGRGIAAGQADRVFERFTRLDEGRSRDVGGTGLGLSIAKAIVDSHRGTIGIRSAPAGGAEFWIRLPVFSAEASHLPPPVPPPVPPTG